MSLLNRNPIENNIKTISQNYKNRIILTEKPNASNRFKSKLNKLEEYYKRMILLDPSNPNIGLYSIKSLFISKQIDGLRCKTEIEKKLQTKKDLYNLTQANQGKIEKNEIFNMEKIIYELKNKDMTLLNKLQNMNLEKKNEEEMKSLQKEKEDNIKELKKVYAQIKAREGLLLKKKGEIVNLSTKLKTMNLEYNRRISRKVNEEIKSSVVIIHREEENEHLNRMKDLFNSKVKEYEERNKRINLEIEKINSEIGKIKNESKGILDRQEKIKLDMERIRKELVIHYHKTLIEGMDVREEGLVWIILSIWRMESEVIIDYFPEYLDEISIDYLFNQARRLIEKKFINSKLTMLKEKIKRIIEKNTFPDYINNTFKTEINNKKINEMTIKHRLTMKNNVFHNDNNKNLNFNKISNDFESLTKDNAYKDFLENIVNEVKGLESRKKGIESEFGEMKVKEIDRIYDEFKNNDYEKRYSCSIENLFKALFGKESHSSDMIYIMTKERELDENIKRIKFRSIR